MSSLFGSCSLLIALSLFSLSSSPASAVEEGVGFSRTQVIEFIDSPTEVISDRKGWNVWYAPEREDTLLTDLFAIQAHHAYLIHVETDYTWELTGIPYYAKTQWHPNAHNLVGFFVDAATAPTVSNFFSGADAHAPLQVYRMSEGRWLLIDQPASTLMEQGVAYWAYSDGASEFSGPLELEFSSSASGGLVFTSSLSDWRLPP